jgi:uncharacterized protein YndB with AHSA1/START domain
MNAEPIVIEQIYDAPTHKVWQAITVNDEMKQWYFTFKDFKPEIGFIFEFYGGPEDGIKYLHKCKVTVAESDKKLSHSWQYDGYPGETLVTWELFDEGGKTRLKLTHAGLETFPQDNPDFARGNFVQGWTYITGTSLTNYLIKE